MMTYQSLFVTLSLLSFANSDSTFHNENTTNFNTKLNRKERIIDENINVSEETQRISSLQYSALIEKENVTNSSAVALGNPLSQYPLYATAYPTLTSTAQNSSHATPKKNKTPSYTVLGTLFRSFYIKLYK